MTSFLALLNPGEGEPANWKARLYQVSLIPTVGIKETWRQAAIPAVAGSDALCAMAM